MSHFQIPRLFQELPDILNHFPDLKEHQLPRTGRLAYVPPGLTLLKRSTLTLIMPCLGKGCCIKNDTVTLKVQ